MPETSSGAEVIKYTTFAPFFYPCLSALSISFVRESQKQTDIRILIRSFTAVFFNCFFFNILAAAVISKRVLEKIHGSVVDSFFCRSRICWWRFWNSLSVIITPPPQMNHPVQAFWSLNFYTKQQFGCN